MTNEFIYITKYYQCGCVTCAAVRPPRECREERWPIKCDVCHAREELSRERTREQKETEKGRVKYLVDGYPMSIYQEPNGYWRGRRYEQSRPIRKSFGYVDPRPFLEEVLF